MTPFLQVNENGRVRDVALIPPGRPLIIGRGEQVDVSFPQDSSMSSRHLSIEVRNQGCLIHDLGSTNGTTVNGKKIESAAIGPGDVICCGTTLFSLDWHESNDARNESDTASSDRRPGRPAGSAGLVKTSAASTPAAAVLNPTHEAALCQPPAFPSGYLSRSAEEILKRFRLRQSVPLTPEDNETTEAFLERLQQFPDGTAEILFLSFALPKRSAVWWLIVCARKLTELREEETAVLELGERWVVDPSDANRRAVFLAAQEEDPGRVAHWVGSAAYFSGGSIAPENSPVVAPNDRVTGQCVLAGITMAALAGPPGEQNSRRKEMSQIAIRIAAEGIQAPKKK